MIKLYNTLTKKIEDFKPINPPNVGMYSCGPTVYDYQHIGHMRRYVGDDVLVRGLKENGYEVKQVMNITDVGHLVSDDDLGEDKMEVGSKKAGLSVWDLAKKYEQQFWESIDALHVVRPSVVLKATDTIDDQIEFIKVLEEKGFTYKTSDGIYFDTSKFPDHSLLTQQSSKELKEGARVSKGEKKNPTDFALWKFSPESEKRQMEWDSPWEKGFPGWHIECSTMSIKELGPHFDIHTGGIDHIPIHHQNEIIQSEAASGEKFVNYWVHHAFLLVNGQKMSKSLGNFITVEDVMKKGFDPIALRYLYFQIHYRQEMNFTWEALGASQVAYRKLLGIISNFKSQIPNEKELIGCAEFENKFMESVNDDLNMPKALAIVWELVNSDYPESAKLASLLKMNKVLGFGFKRERGNNKQETSGEEVPEEVQKLVNERAMLRKEKRYHLADETRHKIKKLGFDVLDENGNTKLIRIDSKG